LESDALYLRLSEESEEVSPGVVTNFSKKGKVLGIEIIGLKERFSPEELSRINVDMPTSVAS